MKKVFGVVILLLVIVVLGCAYYFFWPRYRYILYEYKDVVTNNEHGKWLVTFRPTGDPSGKIVVYQSPYLLNIWHNANLRINKIVIMKPEQVLYTTKEIERFPKGEDRTLSMCRGIELDYSDYVLRVYYSLKEKDVLSEIIEIPLETDFVDKKVSFFEIASGI